MHFLNYDTQQIFKLGEFYNIKKIEDMIDFSIISSILLCKDICFFPLGFIFESNITRKAVNRFKIMFEANILQYSMREDSLKSYLNKKRKGYYPYKKYPEFKLFYSTKSEQIIRKIGGNITPRELRAGNYCLNKWMSQNKEWKKNPQWAEIYYKKPDKYQSEIVNHILEIGEKHQGKPFIWHSVNNNLKQLVKSEILTELDLKMIRNNFEFFYYLVHLSEQGATILFDLPYEKTTFGLDKYRDNFYSYKFFYNWLKWCDLNKSISNIQFYGRYEILEKLRFNENWIHLMEYYGFSTRDSKSESEINIKMENYSKKIEIKNISKKLENDIKYDEIKKDKDKSIINNINNKKDLKEKNKLIKILYISSNPSNSVRLNIEEEIRNIKNKIQSSKFRDNIKFEPCLAVRIEDIQQHLLQHNPDILHFSGHGDNSGNIYFLDENGDAKEVKIKSFVNLIKYFANNIKCVVLNSCYSLNYAQEITKYINCVVGTTGSIDDESALVFAANFYQAVGFGKDIETAFGLGRSAVELSCENEHDYFQIQVKENLNPNELYLI